jgi:hypothetical protein
MERIMEDLDKIVLDSNTATAECGARARCVLATTADHGLQWITMEFDESRWAEVAALPPPTKGWDEKSKFYRLTSAEYLYPKTVDGVFAVDGEGGGGV